MMSYPLHYVPLKLTKPVVTQCMLKYIYADWLPMLLLCTEMIIYVLLFKIFL